MKRALREQVLAKYDNHCAYCGRIIKYNEMQVDHINPQHLGGSDKIENLNPACRMCNHYKGGLTLIHFRTAIKTLHERLQKPYINRVGIIYGIIEIKPFDGKFYYERKNK